MEQIKNRFILDLVSNGVKLDLKKLPFRNSKLVHLLSKNEHEIESSDFKILIKNKVIIRSIQGENKFLYFSYSLEITKMVIKE